MGVHKNVGFDKFPRQGKHLGKSVQVCFNYDADRCIDGVVVRDDVEEPFVTLIKLSDDRYVLSTECMYRIVEPDEG